MIFILSYAFYTIQHFLHRYIRLGRFGHFKLPWT